MQRYTPPKGQQKGQARPPAERPDIDLKDEKEFPPLGATTTAANPDATAPTTTAAIDDTVEMEGGEQEAGKKAKRKRTDAADDDDGNSQQAPSLASKLMHVVMSAVSPSRSRDAPPPEHTHSYGHPQAAALSGGGWLHL